MFPTPLCRGLCGVSDMVPNLQGGLPSPTCAQRRDGNDEQHEVRSVGQSEGRVVPDVWRDLSQVNIAIEEVIERTKRKQSASRDRRSNCAARYPIEKTKGGQNIQYCKSYGYIKKRIISIHPSHVFYTATNHIEVCVVQICKFGVL